METQEHDVIQTFGEALRRRGFEQGDEIMTCAEELWAEVQVEMVEGLLRIRVTWAVIEAATGLTEAGYQELKAQLPGSDS